MNKIPIKQISAALNSNSGAVEFASLEKAVEFVKASPEGILYLTAGDVEFQGRIYAFPDPIEITMNELAGFSNDEVYRLYSYRILNTIIGLNQMANPYHYP